ncbi:MAG: RNA methyltransferase [Candidatus Omnitrophica bacterium]|nr:RNA methyltransferase [Candidatus Omnitrophota bacterium]
MHKEIITSLQNDSVKQAIALREAKTRREYGLTIIDGIREIYRAFDAGVDIEKIFVCPSLLPEQDEQHLLALLKHRNIKIVEVNEAVFEKLAFGQRLEGLLALGRIPQKALSDLKPAGTSLYVIVQALEKPGNIGAILRTCDAAGVDGLILVDAKTDLFNPNVIRASTGTVFSVPTAIADSQAVLDFLTRYKIKTCSLFPQSTKNYTDVDFTGPVAIVLGSEDQGLSEFWVKHTDIDMKIPMNGKADSLNVSVCGAIVIYEALRQRGLVEDSPVLRRSAKKF